MEIRFLISKKCFFPSQASWLYSLIHSYFSGTLWKSHQHILSVLAGRSSIFIMWLPSVLLPSLMSTTLVIHVINIYQIPTRCPAYGMSPRGKQKKCCTEFLTLKHWEFDHGKKALLWVSWIIREVCPGCQCNRKEVSLGSEAQLGKFLPIMHETWEGFPTTAWSGEWRRCLQVEKKGS